MHIAIQGNRGETALREQSHDGLHFGAFPVHRIDGGGIAGRTQQAHHITEEPAGGTAYQRDAARIGIPFRAVMAQEADGTLDVVHHVGVGILRCETVVDGKDCVSGRSEEVGAVGFAAALAVTALIAAAVNDDGDGMNARPLRGIVVHGELLAVGFAIEQAFLGRRPGVGGGQAGAGKQ